MFCIVCTTIDFPTLYGGKRLNDATRASYFRELGTIQEITTRAASCELCKWLSLNLNQHEHVKPITLCVDGSMIYQGRQMSGVTGFMYPIIRLQAGSDTVATLRAVVTDLPSTMGHEMEILDSKQTTIAQFRYWLDACQNSGSTTNLHQLCTDLSSRSTALNEPIPSFQLIDVISQRIVPASSNEEYLALSYVWGSGATPPNADENGSLVKPLPNTISDAISLVRGLGIPFLWVDAVCIPQSHPVIRKEQITRMDRIYRKAVAVIIAAAGDNAGSGLNGFSADYSPHRSILIGGRLVEYQPGPWHHVMATTGSTDTLFTPWSTRGWTFQEGLLSHRRLIFTGNDRIMFECAAGSRQTSPTDVVEQIRASFYDDLSKISAHEMRKWGVHIYQDLLAQYLRRTLTYESDIINGFLGIANYVASEGGTQCCWGIPRREFLAALMWAPVGGGSGAVVRRGKLQDGREVPSWHWAALNLGKWDGLAFVSSGFEGEASIAAAAADFTAGFTREEWKHLEETGILELQGERVELDGDSYLGNGIRDLMDASQNARAVWEADRGCFVTCASWAFFSGDNSGKISGTVPNALWRMATRLGQTEKKGPNWRFVLLTQRGVGDVVGEGDIWERVGWCTVRREEWEGRHPRSVRIKLG